MFHHRSTLHHHHFNNQSSFGLTHQKRPVYLLGWVKSVPSYGRLAWDKLRPVRKFSKVYSWTFGGPLIWKGAKYTWKGMEKAVDAAEIGMHTGIEAAKGSAKMIGGLPARTAYSRLVMLKRMLWDVPAASFSAALRTPIAIAKSPLEAASGVRDAIKSIPGNLKEFYDNALNFRLGGMINSVRKGIKDVIYEPIARPIRPIIRPSADVIRQGIGAELQTIDQVRMAVRETIPSGYNQFRGSLSAGIATQRANKEARAVRREEQKKADLEEHKRLTGQGDS